MQNPFVMSYLPSCRYFVYSTSTYPAPLLLCSEPFSVQENLTYTPKFDLANDAAMCPPERNALRSFYEASRGEGWTEKANWMHPYIRHCDWHKVSCSDDGEVTGLNLTGNGLSGTLSKDIADLRYLQILDLSDNDIKV